jgi:hypothetical protein
MQSSYTDCGYKAIHALLGAVIGFVACVLADWLGHTSMKELFWFVVPHTVFASAVLTPFFARHYREQVAAMRFDRVAHAAVFTQATPLVRAPYRSLKKPANPYCIRASGLMGRLYERAGACLLTPSSTTAQALASHECVYRSRQRQRSSLQVPQRLWLVHRRHPKSRRFLR